MKSKPWITTALRVSINLRNKLFEQYISTSSVNYRTSFKLYRNEISPLLKVSKSNYYNNYFHVNTSNCKKVWKGIRHLVHLKSRSGSTATKLLVDDVEMIDRKSMADAFHNFSANTGYDLTKNIPRRVNKSPLQDLRVPSQDSFCQLALWLFQAASTLIFTFHVLIEMVIFFFSKSEYK